MHDFHQTTTSASAPSIPHIGGRPKPNIHRMDGGSDLLSRLSSFLPQMKNANEDLERAIAAGRGQEMVLDSVDDDGKDYIEMVRGSCLSRAFSLLLVKVLVLTDSYL